MRHYELVTILSPMLSQDQANEAWGQISDFIANRNGDIFQEQPWGTRRLAYPIHQGAHHFLEGNYRLIRFSTETPFNQALESFLKFDERVLRSLVLSIPDREILPDPVASRPAPAAAAAPQPAEGGEAAPSAEAATAEAATVEATAEAATAEAGAETAEATAEPAAEAAPAETAEAPAVETETAEAPAAEDETTPAAEASPEAEATEAEAPAAEVEESPVAEAEVPAGETPEEPAETPAEEEQS